MKVLTEAEYKKSKFPFLYINHYGLYYTPITLYIRNNISYFFMSLKKAIKSFYHDYEEQFSFVLIWGTILSLAFFGMYKATNWFVDKIDKPVTQTIEQQIIPAIKSTTTPIKNNLQLYDDAKIYWDSFEKNMNDHINTRFFYSFQEWHVVNNLGYVKVNACTTDIYCQYQSCMIINCLFKYKNNKFKFSRILP